MKKEKKKKTFSTIKIKKFDLINTTNNKQFKLSLLTRVVDA
jgi:hypothetical protein